MIITKQGYEKLQKEINHLLQNDLQSAIKLLEDTRPFGVSDEFPPEYLQAIDNMNIIEKKISDLQMIYSNSIVFSKNMIKDEKVVGFGATVKIENIENGKVSQYTIVSSYESDVKQGLISVESPMVKEMYGLTIDDEFEVNNQDYVVLDITYHY